MIAVDSSISCKAIYPAVVIKRAGKIPELNRQASYSMGLSLSLCHMSWEGYLSESIILRYHYTWFIASGEFKHLPSYSKG